MKIIVLMLTMAVMLYGCSSDKEEGRGMVVENQIPKSLHCVGGGVIELPSSFVASSVITGTFKGRKNDENEPMDVLVRTGVNPSMFDNLMQKHKAKLEAAASSNVDILREVITTGDGEVIFRIQRIDDAFVSEIFFLRSESMISVRLYSFHNQYAEAEDILKRFARNVKETNSNAGLREVEGFCMGNVTIQDDFEIERGSYLFQNGRGEHFEIDVDSYAKDDRVTLLERMSGPDSLLTVFDVSHNVFRARERTVAGMRAQEWLGSAQVTEDEGERAFQFNLETMRPLPSRAFPKISLTFETAQPLEDGTQTKTLISKDDAIRIWDAVVDSLRSAGS